MSKIKEQLYEKAKKEQAEYHNEVQHLSKDKIIEKAYEISLCHTKRYMEHLDEFLVKYPNYFKK